jgi:hypothetical protein
MRARCEQLMLGQATLGCEEVQHGGGQGGRESRPKRGHNLAAMVAQLSRRERRFRSRGPATVASLASFASVLRSKLVNLVCKLSAVRHCL